jgi:hypothetical protein
MISDSDKARLEALDRFMQILDTVEESDSGRDPMR